MSDPDPLIVLEAARAIHDVPIAAAMPRLAALIDRPIGGSASEQNALMRRVLDANFRLGGAEQAANLARIASSPEDERLDKSFAEDMQTEAIEMLANWARPSAHDRVLNMWRPLSRATRKSPRLPSSRM